MQETKQIRKVGSANVDPEKAKFDRQRIVRFVLWAVAMSITGYLVAQYNPHKAVFVPCIFMAIMVPAVLLPLQPRGNKQT